VEARIAGYAEAVKICFAGGSAPLAGFMKLSVPASEFGVSSASQQSSDLTRHVLSVKKWFIETDEFDRGERLLLNFGHTFGHALESALGFSIPHGVAIAIGMDAALRFSPNRNERTDVLHEYIFSLAAQLPESFRARLADPDWSKFVRALESDKKGTSSHLRFVLEGRNGSLEIVEKERTAATLHHAQSAANEALTLFAEGCGRSL
jgi:3-dehydroquinate synthase